MILRRILYNKRKKDLFPIPQAGRSSGWIWEIGVKNRKERRIRHV
ncbi:hypothetical protein HOLDEFILI_01247 [Holdemania filiformis DSM 12042]|uniref:Uncharacterized protein n=1 Tax=Holdemania filiformis DSM 12042 TaxID=545696 RepID=B9Y612_9FIRM|nr:hypothetical protein HOLDEFILI_01247 [Holdemania filiformis DSM 12042]